MRQWIFKNFAARLMVLALLFCAAPCFADYLLTLRYWRRNDIGKKEEYTVVISLDDYFGRRMQDPSGLAPFLIQGRQRGNAVVDTLAEGMQEIYLEEFTNNRNIYGTRGAEIAATIQQPQDIKKAPNSAVYVFKDGKLVMSYRVVAPKPGGDLPAVQKLKENSGGNASLPEVRTGLVTRPVAGVPPVLSGGEIDLTTRPETVQHQVYQSGALEVKSFFVAPEHFQLTPEIFNLTRWMFEYTPEKVPRGTVYASGQPSSGTAYSSLIFCDVYVNEKETSYDLRRMYEKMGFSVFHTERNENSGLVHYYMYATPETMNAEFGRLDAAFNRHNGRTALVESDPATLARLNALSGRSRTNCRRIFRAIRTPD